MRTTSFFVVADSSQPRTRSREPRSCAGRLVLLAQPRSEIEPEHRLYKTFREASSPKSGGLELIAFLFFGILGSGATLYCGAELFHLVDSGALQHTVQTLLSK
jgi:hypothetical protein